jgi:hypothetical protein
MAIHIYHPNKAIKGFACSFWYSQRDDSVYATIIKQSGWDTERDNGVFKANKDNPDGRVNIKLSFIECAAILECVDKNRQFKTFHDGDEKPKNIAFVPWNSKEGDKSQIGFSFSVTVGDKADTNKNSFYIGLNFAEARLIREFITNTIAFYFNKGNKPQVVEQSSAPQESEQSPNNSQKNESKTLVDPLTDF